MDAAMFSSASDEWGTPFWLFDELDRRFRFTLDPCPLLSRPLREGLTPMLPEGRLAKLDGLNIPWIGHRVFMNPPYGRGISSWVEKAHAESAAGALVVGLLPARVDTAWWQTHVQGVADVRFLAGRLKFGDATNSAPFPSAIAVWWGWPVLSGAFEKAPPDRSEGGQGV